MLFKIQKLHKEQRKINKNNNFYNLINKFKFE